MFRNVLRNVLLLFHGTFSLTMFPTQLLPPITPTNTILNIAVPLIVPAHGTIDVAHAIEHKKEKKLIGSYFAAFCGVVFLEKIHFDIYPIFSIFSALHFRHQFAFMYPFNLLAACTLLSLTGIRPDVVYAFVAFVHTPHQYYVFHPYICNNKELSIFLILSITAMSMFLSFENWIQNPFITSVILGHILYHEI